MASYAIPKGLHMLYFLANMPSQQSNKYEAMRKRAVTRVSTNKKYVAKAMVISENVVKMFGVKDHDLKKGSNFSEAG